MIRTYCSELPAWGVAVIPSSHSHSVIAPRRTRPWNNGDVMVDIAQMSCVGCIRRMAIDGCIMRHPYPPKARRFPVLQRLPFGPKRPKLRENRRFTLRATAVALVPIAALPRCCSEQPIERCHGCFSYAPCRARSAQTVPPALPAAAKCPVRGDSAGRFRARARWRPRRSSSSPRP